MSAGSEGELALHERMAAASGGAALTALAVTPFDVVKTRMQSTDAKLYKGTFDCFAQILRREGPLAFFNGALARAARVVPGQGIIFLSVDVVYDAIAGLAGEAAA